MEAVTEKLNNFLSHSRESIPITITGRLGKDGTFIERLEEAINLDDAANYHVYLNDFTGWSNVPNVNASNKYFYYTYKGVVADPIVFPVSTQSIDTYNYFLENVFTKRNHFEGGGSADEIKIFPVKISYDLTVMRVIMHVSKNTEVEFKDGSWHKEMGFNKKKYTEGVYLAENIADIVRSLNILIRSNLSLDWVFKGKRTNILFNITNSTGGGQMIIEKPNPIKRIVLSNKHIHEIILQFTTEDGLIVDFNGEEFVLTLVIERM